MREPKEKEQTELELLWNFPGPETEFWTECLSLFCRQLRAATAILLAREIDGDRTEWKPMSLWPDAEETKQRFFALREQIESHVADADSSASPEAKTVADGISIFCLPVDIGSQQSEAVIALLQYGDDSFLFPSDRHLRLMRQTPFLYGADLSFEKSKPALKAPASSPLQSAIELTLAVQEETRFPAAAMRLCNELAATFLAERASLGWAHGEYVRVKASSHSEKLNKQSEQIRDLCTAMEESLDQDDEILWPESTASRFHIFLGHEQYARTSGTTALISAPLRDRKTIPCGILTLEREEPFTLTEARSLRLMLDLTGRRLTELYEQDKWFGARLARKCAKGTRRLLGPEHTLAKVIVLLAAGTIAFLALFPWPYRIHSTFSLEAEETFHLPAPFEGYVKEASVRSGDLVEEGDLLVQMDTREAELRIAELSSSIERFTAEAQLARAEGNPSGLHIAVAQAQEAQSDLKRAELIRSQANLQAPARGVVVEEKLQDQIGAPVTKGESLLVISSLDGLYPELLVAQEDIHRISAGDTGSLSFASRPDLRYGFTVEKIEPKAQPQEEGNVFRIYADFSDAPDEWWRPGMTGVAKIDHGERSLLWLFTHRAIDALRLRFWL